MKVYLSAEAAEQLQHILEYLEENWSVKVRDNFISKLERSFQLMSKMPFLFPASEKLPGLRKCVITPQTISYYRVNGDEIEVIAILDARSDA